MATDLERLIAGFDADISKFEKQMTKMNVIFDKQIKDFDNKSRDSAKRMGAAWGALDVGGKFLGLDKAKAAIVGLTASAVVGGIFDLTKKSLEAASAVGDIAQQAGTTTDFLQKTRFAASQAGATFGDLDSGITTLNKNLGDFVNTGAGKAADAFKQLGIDNLIKKGDVRNAEDAFNAIVAGFQKVPSEAQKASLAASLFGKEAGPKLLQLLEQGTDGIAQLQKQAESLGIVLDRATIEGAKEANDKLDALFNIIKVQGVGAFSKLAPEIADFADQAIQKLPAVIHWIEKFADAIGLIKLSETDKLKIALESAKNDVDDLQKSHDNIVKGGNGGILGSIITSIIGFDNDRRLQAAKDQVAKLESQLGSTLDLGPLSHAYDVPAARDPALHPAISDADKAAAEKAEALRQRRAQALAGTVLDAKTAAAALLAAQNDSNVSLLKGSEGYYAAVQKQIQDEYSARVDVITAEHDKQITSLAKLKDGWADYGTAVANINQETNDKIAAANEERKQKLYEAGPGPLLAEAHMQAQAIIQQYQDETAALGLNAGASAKAAFMANALADAKQRQIPITDELIAKLNAEAEAVGAAAQKADDAQKMISANIQVSDTLRQGLEDIGAASLQGFGNMKDAAAQALEQVAELILRLYILKPLVEGLLGSAGTSSGGGSGLFGGLLGSLFGGGGGADWGSYAGDFSEFMPFAKGGVFVPGQGSRPLKKFAKGGVSKNAAIFGEAGIEAAVPLPDGRSIPVSLRMPDLPDVSQLKPANMSGPTIVQHFDLSGALVTQDIFDEIDRRAANQATKAIGTYDRQSLPGRVATLNRHNRQRY